MILTWNLYGCMCHSLFSDTKDVLFERYDFIAIVEVEEAFPFSSDGQWPNYGVTVSTIHQFKGQVNDSLIIHSSHPDFFNRNTSCDIILIPGEQWLVFSDSGNSPSAGMCSMMRYRGLDQISVWGEGSVQAMIDSLDAISQRKFQETISEGDLTTKYPDGSIESLEPFRHSQLHGKVKRYYPDGRLYRTEKYRKGVNVGMTITYASDGSKMEKIRFCKGKKHGTSLFYAGNRLRSKQKYKDGKLMFVRHFSPKGKLEMEIKYAYDPKSNETLEYEAGRLIRRTIATQEGSEFWEYDQSGKLLKHKVDN